MPIFIVIHWYDDGGSSSVRAVYRDLAKAREFAGKENAKLGNRYRYSMEGYDVQEWEAI